MIEEKFVHPHEDFFFLNPDKEGFQDLGPSECQAIERVGLHWKTHNSFTLWFDKFGSM